MSSRPTRTAVAVSTLAGQIRTIVPTTARASAQSALPPLEAGAWTARLEYCLQPIERDPHSRRARFQLPRAPPRFRPVLRPS
jgi:hypothetical protein